MAEPILATCTCGAVEIAAEPPSRFVCHCHCNNCRRAHGAAFVTWAGFPDARLRVVTGGGELAHYVTETGATRSFCRTCGTPMMFRSPRWPGEVHVAVACMKGGPDGLPKAHVYADRAPDWCPIADDLPCYGGEDGTQPLRGPDHRSPG